MTEPKTLDANQTKALLDILSHHEIYQEIQDFRTPGSLEHYGPPFLTSQGRPSSAPSLQALVTTFLTTLPGLRDVSKDFWNKQIGTIIYDFQNAELSESYDKGSLGIRKTLATALSALFEYLVRGVYAGFNSPDADLKAKTYDLKNADDLQSAFRDCMQQAVYRDLINDIFDKTAETDKLTDHSPLVQASHEFGLVNLASFLHFTLIKSPKGQQLLGLLDNANKLVPYSILRQTLKIGNVASMLNAMMKVILAKMSMTSVTNWIGLTQSEDEGMNLLQNIINQVLNWDTRDFKSRASRVEKAKDGPSKDQLKCLKDYLEKPREEHQRLRQTSIRNSQSMVFVILEDAAVSTELSAEAHRHALDYLSIQLSIRDRQEIIKVMCHSAPDHITQSIRDLVSAYEPLIRSVHNSVDLSETVTDFEVFLKDLIRLSRLPDSSRSSRRASTQQATVGDFVALLRKHQHSSHKFLHQVAKNGKDIAEWFREYANTAARTFQQHEKPVDSTSNSGAGDLTPGLEKLFHDLPDAKQVELSPVLSHYAKYLSKLHEASAVRLRNVISSPQTDHPALTSTGTPASSQPPSRTSSPAPRRFTKGKDSPNIDASDAHPPHASTENVNPGPGAYLARWQALLDGTFMTPVEAEGGRVRGTGALPRATVEEGGMPGSREDEDANSDDDDLFADAYERLDQFSLDEGEKVSVPDTRPVVEALGEPFRALLAERGCTW